MKNSIAHFLMEENSATERLLALSTHNTVYSILSLCWIADEVVAGKMSIYRYINTSTSRSLKILYVYHIRILMTWYLIMWLLPEKFRRTLYILFREAFGRSSPSKDLKLTATVSPSANIKLFFENYCFKWMAYYLLFSSTLNWYIYSQQIMFLRRHVKECPKIQLMFCRIIKIKMTLWKKKFQ